MSDTNKAPLGYKDIAEGIRNMYVVEKRSGSSRELFETLLGNIDIFKNYEKRWESYRSRTDFTPEEQETIRYELQLISDYCKTQIIDRDDPQEDGMRNHMRAKNVLVSREQSCVQGAPKLIGEEQGLTKETRHNILLGFAKRYLNDVDSN